MLYFLPLVGGLEESDLGDYKIYGIYLCNLPERLHLPEEAFGNEVCITHVCESRLWQVEC